MFDLGRLILLFVVFVVGARVRSVTCVAFATVAGYVSYLESLSGLASLSIEHVPLGFALAYVFWGPSILPRVAREGLPLQALVAEWPTWTNVMLVLALAIPYLLLSRESAALRPESQRARRLDHAVLALILAMVVHLIRFAIPLLLARFTAGDYP